jgi:hypothetical protein
MGNWQCEKFGCCKRTFLGFNVDHTAKCDNSHMVRFMHWSLLVDIITVAEMFMKELSQFFMKLKFHVGFYNMLMTSGDEGVLRSQTFKFLRG